MRSRRSRRSLKVSHTQTLITLMPCLLRSKASSRENLSLHLSSKDLRSSEVGLLLCLHLLDLGDPSERFFF